MTCLLGHFSHPRGGAWSHLPTSFSPLQSPALRGLHHLCSTSGPSGLWGQGTSGHSAPTPAPGPLCKQLPSPTSFPSAIGLLRRPQAQAVHPPTIPASIPSVPQTRSLAVFLFVSPSLWVSVSHLWISIFLCLFFLACFSFFCLPALF